MKNQLNLLICAAMWLLLILGCTHKSSKEGSAMASLRTLHGAQATYQSTTGDGNFAASFDQLVTLNLIDSQFRGGEPQKNGYVFRMSATPKSGADGKAKFSANADPVADNTFSPIERFWNGEPNSLEMRHFYIDESGILRYSKGRSATAEDTASEASTDYHSKPLSDQIVYLTERLKEKDWYTPRFERAAAYFKLHKAAQAVEDMRQGIKFFSAYGEKAITNPSSPTEVRGWTDSLRSELRSHLGELATYQEAAGNYAEAASTYEQMFTLPANVFNKQSHVINNPDLNQEHLHYWFVLTKSGNSQRANEFLEKQISQVGKKSNWLLIAKFLLGKQNEADFLKENSVNEYVDGKPRDLEGALFFAGIKRSMKHDESGAKLFYKRFLEKNKTPSAGHIENFNEIQLAQYYLNESIDF